MVRSRTVPSSLGGFAIFPATIITAIVSPIARPMASEMPDIIVFFAVGRQILKIVSILFAPKLNDASFKWIGTACSAETAVFIIVGRIIIVKTIITASIESPTMG